MGTVHTEETSQFGEHCVFVQEFDEFDQEIWCIFRRSKVMQILMRVRDVMFVIVLVASCSRMSAAKAARSRRIG